MKKKHRVLADKHTATFPPDIIAKWEGMIQDWDADHSKPDPYKEPESCQLSLSKENFISNLTTAVNLAEVRDTMAQEESLEIFPHKVTAAVFIRTGLEIEDHQ